MDYRFTLLLVLTAGAYAGPAGRRANDVRSASTCSTTCTTRNKFSYAPDTTYDFKYEVETKTSMLGASEDHSLIGITAIASIEVHSKCEMILNVRDVTIYAHDSQQYQDQDKKGEFSNALQQHPLRFSFQDGTIDSVCPDPDEEAWVLNIKRGILSTFQNSMVNFANDHSGIESDVSGKCKTDYQVKSEGWRSVTLKKSKTMEDCMNRHDFESAIQTIPFRISSGLKSLPILKTTHECDQEVNKAKGILTKTLCHEMHVLRPFSKETSGATTEITQILDFLQEKQSVNNGHVGAGKGQALHFEHKQEQEVIDLSAKAALDLLKDVCKSNEKEVTPDTPSQFSSLVSTMKRMDYTGLRRVYNQVHKSYFCKTNGERVRKFAFDAIPMVGTDASVELMKTLISNKNVKSDIADIWLASLTFIQRPTVKMIQEIAQLTGLPWMSTKVLLPLSALVHSYCHVNPECEAITEVKNIINEIERNIQGGCKVTQENFRLTMMSLRAIGNTGHAETSVPSLYNCMTDKENPMDIRIAAVDAFRRLSCGADRNNMMAIFRDVQEDSELRIAAYQGVMRCPTAYIISQVKETLASEEVNQVGSFVWSHLTNLMESTDPANKLVQQLLNDEPLDTEFDLDRTKFSRNFEGSIFLDSLNAGAKMDSNLVWSTKSFVPRSGYFNLTTQVFGESLNLFEMGGRVEGLDHLLESYFGPVGVFNKDTEENNEVPEADPKFARLSGSKLNSIRSKAKAKADDLRGSMFMRMFGNELSYSMFGANNGVDTEMKSDSDMMTFLKKWKNNQHHDVFLTRSFMFLDSTYTVPTIAGLPLKLMINGTATVALTAGGQLDLMKPASNILLEGNLEPSGSVEIDSMMSVDAIVTRGGLKMTSTLHTSTGAKAKVQVTDGSVVDLTFDMTKEKQEIVDIKNTFFIVYNEIEKEQNMIVKNRLEKNLCTGNKVQRILGVEFCASFSVPNATFKDDAPHFPFSGPAEATISMYKRDIPNGYKFEAKVIKTPVQTLFRVLSDTPGSDQNRAIGLDVAVSHKENTLDVDFLSPWKKATLTGELIDKKDVKGLNGRLNVDDGDRLYHLDAKINIDETGDRVTYTPAITLNVPDWKDLHLTGIMKYVRKESLDSDLTISGATDEPITIQAAVMNTKTKMGTQIKFNHEKGTGYTLDAIVDKKTVKKNQNSIDMYTPRLFLETPGEVLIEAGGKVEYIKDKSMKVDGKIQKVLKNDIVLKGAISKTEIPKKKRVRYNAQMKMECGGKSTKFTFMMEDRQGKNIFNRVRFDYNFDKTLRDTLILQNRVKMNIAKTKTVIKLTSKLNSLRDNNLDSALSVNYAKGRFLTSVAADLKYGRNMKSKSSKDKIDFIFEAKHKLSGAKKTVNYTMDFNFPAKSIEVKIKGGHIQEGKVLTEDIEVQYHPKRTVSMNLRLHNKTSNYPNYAGEIGLGLPEGRAMSFAGAFGRESEDKYVSSLEFEIIKGRRTRIDTMLKMASESLYEVEVGVQLPDLDPVRVFGGFNKMDNGYKVSAWFKRGEKLYSVSSEAMLDLEQGKLAVFKLDVTVPSRRVKIILDGHMIGTARHAMVDIQWDADNNLNDRFLINVTSDYKGYDDFEMAIMLHYPGRTIDFNMKHAAGARYITNARLSWSPTDKIELDLIFRNDEIEGQKRTELSVSFSSPFEPYEELGLSVSLFRDASQYQTKSSVTWAKKKKILVSATARVPFSVNSVDIVGTITTPFKGVKSMTAQIKHRYSDDLHTFVLFEWGPNRLSFTADGNAKVSALGFESFDGKFDIRTPWEGMRIFLVSAEFTNNKQNKITSRLSLDVSRYSAQKTLDKYLIEMDMLYNRLPDSLTNDGNLRITIPGDDIRTDWKVALKRNMQHVSLSIMPQRGNNFKVELKNSLDMSKISYKYRTAFLLVVPAESFKQMSMTFGFEARDKFIEASTLMLKDSVPVFSHSFKYQLGPGSFQLNSHIKYVTAEEVSFKILSSHSLMPYRASLEYQWEPNQRITADSNIIYNEFGMYDMSLKINTPFPRYQNFVLSSTRKRMGLNWEASSEFEFAPQQKIQLETVYRYDHVKLGSVTLKTPFPQFPGLDTSVRVDGNPYNFKGDASFSMAPYVGKIASDFSWAYYKGTSLSGIFNLNTPFRQYPYLKAKVNSNILGVSRVSKVEVEYLPTQIVKVEADYRFTSLETLEGNLKVTSPYTDNKQVVAGFKHIGNQEEFATNAKITSKYFQRPVFTKATFSSKNGVISTFEMDSPFRGYETVKWNLNHQGTMENFHTKVEYETSGDKITVDNVFNIKDKFQVQSTLTTPFSDLSKAHIKFMHDVHGILVTETILEAALNDQTFKAEVDLSDRKASSSARVLISTPFEKIEKMDLNLARTGSLNDFEVTADLEYDQKWHGSLKHKADVGDIHSSINVQTPIRQGYDINAIFDYEGVPTHFETSTEVSIGPEYKSSSKTKFVYELYNVTATVDLTTVMGEDIRKSFFSLEHGQTRTFEGGIDVSTQVYGQTRGEEAKLNSGLTVSSAGADIKLFAVLELPVDGFESSQLFYEVRREQITENHIKQFGKVTFETPLLERYEQITETEMEISTNNYRSGPVIKSQHEISESVGDTISIKYKYHRTNKYGDDEVKDEMSYEPGKFSYKITTTYEGYETTTVDVEYDKLDSNGQYGLQVNGKLTCSSLPSDVTAEASYKASHELARGIENELKWKLDYGPQESISFTEEFKTGSYRMKLSTPYEGYEDTEVTLTNDKYKSADLMVSSSGLVLPITASYSVNYDSALDMELSGKFTSGFTNFTSIKAEVRNTRSGSTYKPYVLFSWEDEARQLQEIEADGTINFSYLEFKDMTAGFKFAVKSPYESLEDMKIQYDHMHYVSPMRAKEVVYVRFNRKTYLDMEAEFGAVNKFTGSVIFKEPRKMVFSFSGLNEGESIDVDLNINWNKLDRKSMFRLQFGLADNSDNIIEKKVFHVKITNPNRIIAINNNLEIKHESIKSDGRISWDLENRKEATYKMEFTRKRFDIKSKLEIVVPTRTIDISGSSVSKNGNWISDVSVFWDMQRDADKMVKLTVTLTPTPTTEAIVIEVKVPSLKKELTLKSDITMSPNGLHIIGNTEFSYAPDAAKTVYIKYSIHDDGISSSSGITRANWNLKHAQTSTDIDLTSILTTSAIHTEMDSTLKYTTSQGDVTENVMKVDFDKEDRLITVEMTCPDDTVLLSGQLTPESPYVLTIDLKHNTQPKWNTVWKVDTVERTLDASMTYGDKQREISTQAFFPNDTSFQSETTSESERGLQQEGYMTANLDQRVLHGHLKWRPEIVKDVTSFGADCLLQLGTEMNTVLQDTSSGFGNEVSEKYRSISGSFVTEMAPLSDTLKDEVRLIQKDLREMRRTLKKMHKNNELYLGTLEELYSGTVDNVVAGYTVAVKKVGSGYHRMQESIEEISNQIDQYPLQEKYTALKTRVSNFIEESRVVIEEEIQLLLKQMTDMVEMSDKTMNDVLAEIEQYVLALVDELALTPYLEDLKEYYEKLQVEYPDVKNLKVHKLLSKVHQLLIDSMEQSTLVEKYRLISEKASEILKVEFGDMLENEDIKDLHELVQEIYEQVTWLYKYTEIDTIALRALIDKILAATREQMMAEFNQLPIGILDMHKSRFITFDLEKGEVEFDLYLPIPMDNFEQLLRFSVKKYMAKLEKMVQKYFPRRDLCLWDMYYRLPPVQWSMRTDWLPPYDVFATVSGKQHYRTFDGRHFDLAGLCSYLLVEDMADGNFSVVQKYIGGPKKLSRDSLSIMVQGKTIEIMQNYMVKVNGQPRELPYEIEGISIVRRLNRIIMTTDVGLGIVSDFNSDYHVIGLSGWYYGKVSGLLGTYDNEPYNDMMLPEGDLETRDQKFLNAWEVDKSCRSRRIYVTEETGQKSDECAAVFEKSSSSLRPCFLQVDPAEYQRRCDMEPSAACEIAALYKHTCAQHGITVDIPQTCMKCDAAGAEFMADETVKFEHASGGARQLQKSMDIVFVVEELDCNQNIAAKLNDIIHGIDQSMLKTGGSDNRYGLVAFSDDGFFSHTMEGQLFNEASKFAKGAENMQYTKSRIAGYDSSPLGAMMYSTTLPFRPGVAKSIILISCSSCPYMYSLSYSRMSAELRQRDITLHVLRDMYDFKLTDGSIPTSKIYGIDSSQAYIHTTSKDEPDLFPLINIPRDDCVDLALNSNGSLFNSAVVSLGPVRLQKAFLGVYGDRITNTEKGSECQSCSCELDESGTPHTVCRRCDVPVSSTSVYVGGMLQYVVDYKNHLTDFVQATLS